METAARINEGDIIETQTQLEHGISPRVKIPKGARGIVEKVSGNLDRGLFLQVSFEEGSDSTMKAMVSGLAVRKIG